MMKEKKKLVALMLSFALVAEIASVAPAEAAKKPSMSKKLSVTVGKEKTLKVKNIRRKVKWKVFSGKQYIAVKRKGKFAVTVKGKKKGNSIISATVSRQTLTCKITVAEKLNNAKTTNMSTSVPADEAKPTNASTNKPTPTRVPTDEPKKTSAPTEEPAVSQAPADKPVATEEPAASQAPAEEPVATSEPTNKPINSEFSIGNGTSASPYEITNLDELNKIRNYNGACFKQTADIDMDFREFTPLFTADEPFTGTYDGGGHTISNVSDSFSSECVGIFCVLGEQGTIQNLIVENSSFRAYRQVGAIVGKNKGTISNCSAKTNSIIATDFEAGALCGTNDGTIKNCSSEGNSILSQGGNGWAGAVCAVNIGSVSECHTLQNSIFSKFSGGVAANNAGNVVSCQSEGNEIKCEVRRNGGGIQSGSAGGIAGSSSGTIRTCTVKECSIIGIDGWGLICCIGGIVGSNSGNSLNNTYDGTLNQAGNS